MRRAVSASCLVLGLATLVLIEGRMRFGDLEFLNHTPEELFGPMFKGTPWPGWTEFALAYLRYPLDLLAGVAIGVSGYSLVRSPRGWLRSVTLLALALTVFDLFWSWCVRLAYT